MEAIAGILPRPRVLFIAEAVTLAHVARAAALASSLPRDQYEVRFAADPRYENVVGTLPFPVERIFTLSSERFFRALATGSPIYDVHTLAAYVDEDRRLIRDHEPDVVVGDFRLSLDVSAKLERVPYVTVTNAYWSPYALIRAPVPELAIVRLLGVSVAQKVFDVLAPLVSRLHARPINQLRKRHGLPLIVPDTRIAYTQADLTLYADLPELVPTAPLPPGHTFIGPVLWSPPIPLPEWWREVPTSKPIAYVTLGSSGQGAALDAVLDAVDRLGFTALVATAARSRPVSSSNAWVADYLPGSQASRRAALVVCNGGSPTCYQALAEGVPVLGLPANLDQHLNMAGVVRAGAGMTVRSDLASPRTVAAAVLEIVDDPRFGSSARKLRELIRNRPYSASFAAALRSLLRSGDA
jgi:UDP:flavonoid glycosyltransferase YjiC (YdhE family)